MTLFNVGYVIDRTVGNTGGLGGAFGFPGAVTGGEEWAISSLRADRRRGRARGGATPALHPTRCPQSLNFAMVPHEPAPATVDHLPQGDAA